MILTENEVMELAIKKIILGIGVGTLSFFGWEPKDYAHLLPKNISEVILPTEDFSETETISTTTQNTTSTQTRTVNAPGKNFIKRSGVDETRIPRKKSTATKPPQTSPQTKSPTNTSTKTPAPTPPPEKPSVVISPKISFPTPTPPTETLPPPVPSFSLEDKIKNSVANIYCLRSVTNGIEKITGSAAAISPGVYLTNAHVALYILLENSTAGQFSCFIRTGSPARKMYKAEIVYFPKSWAERNANFLSSTNHIGTGEKDYAIIKTSTFVGSAIPSLSHFEISLSSLSSDSSAYLAGYPISLSDGALLDISLYEILQKVSVTEALNFGFGVDALGTAPTLLAENGSSGGALTDEDGKLSGIMVATTIDAYSGKKNIRAITIPYINSDIQNESGHDLYWYIQNATNAASDFKQNSADSFVKTILGK